MKSFALTLIIFGLSGCGLARPIHHIVPGDSIVISTVPWSPSPSIEISSDNIVTFKIDGSNVSSEVFLKDYTLKLEKR